MSRGSNATKIIQFLEKKINCDNIMKNTVEYELSSKDNIKKLSINNTISSFEIIEYDDSKTENETKINRNKIDSIISYFDFITEANVTGNEYFPYLYGVLDCHGGKNSVLYVYYEYFEYNLDDIINTISHTSEWYSIIFQIILIYHYMSNMGFYHKFDVKKIIYNKIEKPYFKKYTISGKEFNIQKKYDIVFWDMYETTKNENKSFIDDFILYVSNVKNNIDKNNIKNIPSNKLINMLSEISKDNNNMIDIMYKYFTK